jgi:hypothetical protein
MITVTTLAGCSGEQEQEPEAPEQDSEPAEESTPEPTPEPTEEPTPTHQIGENFTVGNGDQTVEYIINSVESYEIIGNQFIEEEANGIFLVAELEMTNQTDQTIDIGTNHLKMVDSSGNQFDSSDDAMTAIDQDDRIESESIIFEQLNPGLSTQGAVGYDVAPGESYALLIEPLGVFSNAESHLVEVGSI